MAKKQLLVIVALALLIGVGLYVHGRAASLATVGDSNNVQETAPPASSDVPPVGNPGSSAPPGAVESCAGKTLGATCQFTINNEPYNGACQQPGDTMVCGPSLSAAGSKATTTN